MEANIKMRKFIGEKFTGTEKQICSSKYPMSSFVKGKFPGDKYLEVNRLGINYKGVNFLQPLFLALMAPPVISSPHMAQI